MPSLGSLLLLMLAVFMTTAQRRPRFDAMNVLEKFGYLDDLPEGVDHSEATRAEAIREFQRFNGLTVTGQLDRRTLRKMRQPRCGLPDVVKPAQRPQGLRDPNQPLAFYAPGYKWDNNEITYKFVGYTRKLGGSDQHRSIANAFGKWAEITPLRFRETTGQADIDINFGRYNHGDGAGNSFDGRGGTLAHAFFPGGQPLSGDTHFDDDEEWTVREDRGTNLEIVAAHEFGHALGLGHSNVPSALMAPYYAGYDPNYQLHADDKRGIQTIYGSGRGGVFPRNGNGGNGVTPRPTRRPVTPRPTRRPTTPRPSGRYCDLPFDAIVLSHDDTTYAFRQKKIYKLEQGQGVARGFPKQIRRIYPRAPYNVDAVVYDRIRRKTYFFKGSKLWRFTNYQLDEGYPQRLPSALRRPRAALQWRDGRIYLFKTDSYFPWYEGERSIPAGYPRPLSEFWGGLRNGIGAAVRWSDGSTYFFKGKRYFKFDDYYRRVATGYPKDKAGPWLGCGSPSRP